MRNELLAQEVADQLPECHLAALLRHATYDDRPEACRRVAALTEALITSTGRGLVLSEADLTGCNLAGFDLRRAVLNRTQLHGTDLTGANLAGASLICPGMERTRLTSANLNGAYLHALAAQVCDFSGCDLSGVTDATGSLFHGCNLSHARASRAVLSGATFYQCDLTETHFDEAALQGASFNECLLTGTNFERASVAEAVITKCPARDLNLAAASGEGLVLHRLVSADRLRLNGARLPGLRLNRVSASGIDAERLNAPALDAQHCVFHKAGFRSAYLIRSRWDRCTLDGGNFSNADLTAASFDGCSAAAAGFDGARGENLRVLDSRFAGADMRQFSGRCVVLRDSDFTGSDWSGAYLYRAMITGDPPAGMSLRGAKLVGANLVQAYVTADMSGAELKGVVGVYSRLNQAVLHAADLSGANLYQAGMVKTDFTNARVTGVRPPIFATRCPGLAAAFGAENGDGEAMLQFLRDLAKLIDAAGGSSS